MFVCLFVCWLLDLVAQLSDAEIGHERIMKPDLAGIGHQDASSVRSRVMADDDDDDDDDDDIAFTHSSALTIKSCQRSLESSFSHISNNSCEQASESSVAVNCVKQPCCVETSDFEPSVVSHNNMDSHFNPGCTRQYEQRTRSPPDVGGMTAATNADSDLRSFLSELGLGKYADVFYEQDVDLPMFLTLNEDDLKEIGIRFQPL